MNLTKHFTLEELTRSARASALGIRNVPPERIIQVLRYTANMLEVVREDVLGGKPILISSGYRCLQLNRALGSKDTSAHIKGLAVDFTCPQFGTPLQICQEIARSDTDFDQLIHESVRGGEWVHLAFPDPLSVTDGKKQLLTIDSKGTRQGLA